MDLGLDGKVAVVTGASKGIGLGVSRALAREGAVVLMAARDEARVAAAAREVSAEFGTETLGLAADVSTAEGCARVVEAAREFGGADILVNNAGTGSN